MAGKRVEDVKKIYQVLSFLFNFLLTRDATNRTMAISNQDASGAIRNLNAGLVPSMVHISL